MSESLILSDSEYRHRFWTHAKTLGAILHESRFAVPQPDDRTHSPEADAEEMAKWLSEFIGLSLALEPADYEE